MFCSRAVPGLGRPPGYGSKPMGSHFGVPPTPNTLFFRVSCRPSTKKGGVCHGKPGFPKKYKLKKGQSRYLEVNRGYGYLEVTGVGAPPILEPMSVRIGMLSWGANRFGFGLIATLKPWDSYVRYMWGPAFDKYPYPPNHLQIPTSAFFLVGIFSKNRSGFHGKYRSLFSRGSTNHALTKAAGYLEVRGDSLPKLIGQNKYPNFLFTTKMRQTQKV